MPLGRTALIVVGALIFAFMAEAFAVGQSARADVWLRRDGSGALELTNVPKRSARPLLGRDVRTPGLRRHHGSPLIRDSRRFDSLIREVANRHGVDFALVKAVIRAESGFNPRAVSPKGARGLMQLMPRTARMHNVRNVFSPGENIEGGTEHLRMLLDRYAGNVRLALAAYNAGIGAVEKYGRRIPPYRETQTYVRRVLSFRLRYMESPTTVASIN